MCPSLADRLYWWFYDLKHGRRRSTGDHVIITCRGQAIIADELRLQYSIFDDVEKLLPPQEAVYILRRLERAAKQQEYGR